MNKLLILFILAGFFFFGCITTYDPSTEQLEENRKAYEQYERDRIQQDILKELKKQNKRK